MTNEQPSDKFVWGPGDVEVYPAAYVAMVERRTSGRMSMVDYDSMGDFLRILFPTLTTEQAMARFQEDPDFALVPDWVLARLGHILR